MAGAMKDLDPSTSVAALLGTKLRKLRTRAGLTQRELGKKVYVSHNRIAQVELGTDPPSEQLVQSLETVLDAQGDLTDIWRLLDYSPVPQWAERYIRLESQAVQVCKFTPVVPGLLQTEDYARAVLSTGLPVGRELLQERVSVRLERQAVLRRTQAPLLWTVLDEVALRRPVGGTAVMGPQLARLLSAVEAGHTILQVMPFSRGEHAAMSGAITVLRMKSGARVAYLEGHDSGELIECSVRVDEIALKYDLLRAQALPPDDSLAMIRKVMEDDYPCEIRELP